MVSVREFSGMETPLESESPVLHRIVEGHSRVEVELTAGTKRGMACLVLAADVQGQTQLDAFINDLLAESYENSMVSPMA